MNEKDVVRSIADFIPIGRVQRSLVGPDGVKRRRSGDAADLELRIRGGLADISITRLLIAHEDGQRIGEVGLRDRRIREIKVGAHPTTTIQWNIT